MRLIKDVRRAYWAALTLPGLTRCGGPALPACSDLWGLLRISSQQLLTV